ncbi:MAG: AarF/ABC1/UbiB kinase family protein [Planctomycetes bacterium]|nr:AarF/ABC1/UbiB kinase family protein [Planctomycetota bacterium]
MNPQYTDTLGNLPFEDDRQRELEDALTAMVAEVSRRPLPVSRVTRLLSMGALPLKLFGTRTSSFLRQLVVRDEERKALMAKSSEIKQALQVLHTMGYLRGVAAKAGQLLAAWPDLAPPKVCELLDSLHFQAPPLNEALVEAQLEAELGAAPEDIFADFDWQPCAAASIGQVHRATLKSGERVAVKIQYPGIARTIRSDLANLRTIMYPLRLTHDWRNLMARIQDIEETVGRECDYRAEADFTERAREALATMDGVVVPRVHRALSTERVLVTDWLEGRHLAAWMARSPSPDTRTRAIETILRASARLFYEERFVWADPSPGNVVFLDSGEIGLLDFGCCLIIDDDDWALTKTCAKAFHHGGLPSDLELAQACDMDEADMKRRPELIPMVRSFVAWLWEPLQTKGAVHLDEAYFRRGVELLKELTRKRLTRAKPFNTWTNRFYVGLRALFFRLDAPADYERIHREELGRLQP